MKGGIEVKEFESLAEIIHLFLKNLKNTHTDARKQLHKEELDIERDLELLKEEMTHNN